MTTSKLYEKLKAEWSNCEKCGLGKLARNHVLFSGPLTSSILFVGEGPGNEEDYHGRAFVGRAGTLLRAAITDAGFDHERYSYSNLVACRPSDDQTHNREPTREEIAACRPRLLSVIGIVRPRGIVVLGRLARHYLPMSGGLIQIQHLTHPSYIIRNGGQKNERLYAEYVGALRDFLTKIEKG